MAMNVQAQSAPLWMRYPAVSPDGTRIAFTYGGQIWRTTAKGSEAVPLTSALFYSTRPVWSPDGQQIAFASTRYGNLDVFIIPAGGGEIVRLTNHSMADVPYAFSPDGKFVYFSSIRLGDAKGMYGGCAVGACSQLYAVPVMGGRERLLIPTPALEANPSPDGRFILYNNLSSEENEWRKHAVSEATRDIWVYDTKEASHRQITTYRGEDRDPVWSADGQDIYYLSESSGSFNIWRRSFKGKGDPVQLTFHKTHPVRFLSRSNTDELVYGYDGEIWRLPKDAKQPIKVEIQITQGSLLGGPFYTNANEDASELAASADGTQLAIVARGEIFVVDAASGRTRRITNTPEHERSVSFSPDGRSLLYVSQRGGTWNAYETTMAAGAASFLTPGQPRETVLINSGSDVLQASYSPDGKRVAYLEDRKRIRVFNKETRQTITVLKEGALYSYSDNDLRFTWSPDGRWIAATTGSAASNEEISLIDAEGKSAPINISQSGYRDLDPVFSPDGKALFYLSTRYGLKTSDAKAAELDVLATFLTQDAYDAFTHPSDQLITTTASGQQTAAEVAPSPAWQPELDGLRRRSIRISPFSASLLYVAVAPDGKSLLLVTMSATAGMVGYRINLGRPGMAAAFNKPYPGAGFATDKAGQTLFFLSPAGIDRVNLATGATATIPFAAEMAYDLRGEMAYFFEYCWRMSKQKYYRADMNGVDWDLYRKEYAKYLPHIVRWEDFGEMLSEMAGELNGSHMGSTYSNPPNYGESTADLGLYYDHSFEGPGMKIADFLKGGPAGRANSKLRAGAVILAVDGDPITKEMDIYPLLNRKTSVPVRLTIQPAGGGNTVEEVVTPVSFLETIMHSAYDRWIDQCKKLTEKLSNGRLGYIHIEAMDTASYQSFYSQLFGGEFAGKEGVVVDVRYNGGGNLADLLISDLSAKSNGSVVDRDGDVVSGIPQMRWSKPSILLANAFSYSDGSIFPHLYKDTGVGSFVGQPVPGTGTSVWWIELLGKKLQYGVPELARKDRQGKWFENSEDQPDILIRNTPESIRDGRDLQLEAAVEALLKQRRKE